MTIPQIITRLLQNRNLNSPEAIDEFFHPPSPDKLVTPFDSSPAISLIRSHMSNNHKIIIYGDYDVDGMCSTAILWETLYSSYPHVLPHIPDRATEGYGLSIAGLDKCLAQDAKLIIAVDNGIVAHAAVDYCRAQGCDLIIIDHHEVAMGAGAADAPNANIILHSTASCAAGLTWLFCRDWSTIRHEPTNYEQLSLVSLAVICDLVPLLGINRSFAVFGLRELNQTKRYGLRALHTSTKPLGTYDVGFIIGPRLNAAGRLESALDSLRLLCTKDLDQANQLATKLNAINASRQDLTESAVIHALTQVSQSQLIVVSDASYHEGIIGLIASRLSEKYYRPTIAISVGDTHSKGSARSVSGFHITDHLRQFSHLMVNVGGHAGAAGFTIKNTELAQFVQSVQLVQIPEDLLVRKSRVDIEIPLSIINFELYIRLKDFEPFGLGNPTPTFQTNDVAISNPRRIGKTLNHLKFKVGDLDAVYFNAPMNYEPHATSNIVYTIDENTWNGNTTLQLIVKGLSSSV